MKKILEVLHVALIVLSAIHFVLGGVDKAIYYLLMAMSIELTNISEARNSEDKDEVPTTVQARRDDGPQNLP